MLNKKLKIKVCGMREAENIKSVVSLSPDFIGFIFYPKSPRYVESIDTSVLNQIPRNVLKIGVFVNADMDFILQKVKEFQLQGVQLHGNESDELCYTLKSVGLIVIKAFPVAEPKDILKTEEYVGACDFFLFDTKTPEHGGSGKKFDWNILNQYKETSPFFLSGGIGPEELTDIKHLSHPQLAGVDLNSKFEIRPALKNTEKLEQFINELRAISPRI